MPANVIVPPFTAPTTTVVVASTTLFPFDFPFWESADILVYKDNVLQSSSLYTVVGLAIQSSAVIEGGYGSGTVTFTTGVSNCTIKIDREVVGDRETQFSRSTPLDMRALNGDLNRLTARQQDMDRLFDRAITVPYGTTAPSAQSIIDAALLASGKVSTADLAASTGAALVGSINSVTGSVARTAQAKLRDVVSAKDFGAVGDGTTNNATAFALIQTAVQAGTIVHFPAGTYATAVPLNFTAPGYMTADPGTRIKLTAAANYVVQFDFTGGAGFFDHLCGMRNFVLDGGGFAVDGLNLKGVISGNFDNVRVTNVTRAGLHLGWAQQCLFTDYHCSGNVETFTTTPVNAILIDTAASSANTFVGPVIAGVSGDGIRALSLFNTVILNGTSEGNGGAGIRFGVAGSGLQCLGNTVIGMDIEVNTGGDIVVDNTAIASDFIGLKSGFGTTLGVRVMSGAAQTVFIGGTVGATQVDSGAVNTRFDNVSFIGAGAGLTDAGTKTSWRGLRNFSDGVVTADSTYAGYLETSVAAAGTYNANAKLDRFHVVNALGSTLTIANPTNPEAGQKITYEIFNFGGTLTVTWGTAFTATGWVSPPNSENRTITFGYNSNFGEWYVVALSPLSALAAVADVAASTATGVAATAAGVNAAAAPTQAEFNALVTQFNALVTSTNALVTQFNTLVTNANTEIASHNATKARLRAAALIA